MAGKPTRQSTGQDKPAAPEVMFLCRYCQKPKSIGEMRRVRRFVPALVVCQDCARKLE